MRAKHWYIQTIISGGLFNNIAIPVREYHDIRVRSYLKLWYFQGMAHGNRTFITVIQYSYKARVQGGWHDTGEETHVPPIFLKINIQPSHLHVFSRDLQHSSITIIVLCSAFLANNKSSGKDHFSEIYRSPTEKVSQDVFSGATT